MANTDKSNFFYSFLYHGLLILIPVITIPYITRVIGAVGIGEIAYTQSVFIFFNFFATLGAATYGQRIIAVNSEDKDKLSKAFWEVVFIKIMLTCFSLFAYVLFIPLQEDNFKILYYILVIDMLVNAIDITWLYQGYGNFKKTAIYQFFIKITSVALVFAFVKNSQDVWIYVLCFSLPMLIGYLSMWMGVGKYVNVVKISNLNLIGHVRGIVVMFLPFLAVLVFNYSDKLIIQYITQDIEKVAYYDLAMKFIFIATGVLGSVSNVVMPSLSRVLSSANKENTPHFLTKYIKFNLYISTLVALILYSVSPNLLPWFLGDGYTESILILQILAPMIIVRGFNSLLGYGYLIASHQEKKYTIVSFVVALTAIALCFILIDFFDIAGVAFSIFIAELVGFFIIAEFTKKVVPRSVLMYYFLISVFVFFSSSYFSTFIIGNVESSPVNSLLIILVNVVVFHVILAMFFHTKFFKIKYFDQGPPVSG